MTTNNEKWFIAIGPYCWGRAQCPRKAKRLAKQNFPHLRSVKWKCDVYEVGPEDKVNLVTGAIRYYGDKPRRLSAKEVREY